MYDVIIIGAGPAGLTAGIYTSRRGLKTLILSKDLGGQASMAPHVENYPGFRSIQGYELMRKFEEQVKNLGVQITYEEVEGIRKKGRNFIVKTGKEYETKTLILAFGRTPRSLGVPGEKKFLGKGISYCATCDGPLFRDKTVAVIGGGNSALDAALFLSKIARKVYLIHRGELSAFESVVERAKKENIGFLLNKVVTEFKGGKLLESLSIQDINTKKRERLRVNGAFIEIGSEVDTSFIKGLVKLNKDNQIIVNNRCETSHPGIFAAGDITNTPFKQIIISGGEGAKAALQAYHYLTGMKPKYFADWGKKR